MSVSDDDYSKCKPCTLNYIFTFLSKEYTSSVVRLLGGTVQSTKHGLTSGLCGSSCRPSVWINICSVRDGEDLALLTPDKPVQSGGRVS